MTYVTLSERVRVCGAGMRAPLHSHTYLGWTCACVWSKYACTPTLTHTLGGRARVCGAGMRAPLHSHTPWVDVRVYVEQVYVHPYTHTHLGWTCACMWSRYACTPTLTHTLGGRARVCEVGMRASHTRADKIIKHTGLFRTLVLIV